MTQSKLGAISASADRKCAMGPSGRAPRLSTAVVGHPSWRNEAAHITVAQGSCIHSWMRATLRVE